MFLYNVPNTLSPTTSFNSIQIRKAFHSSELRQGLTLLVGIGTDTKLFIKSNLVSTHLIFQCLYLI